MAKQDGPVAEQFSRARAGAELLLRKEMEARGMRREDGWQIVEFMREYADSLEMVLRPLHFYQAADERLECVVAIQGESVGVDLHAEL